MEITVDPEVEKLISDAGCDYRLCTACLGPALVPTSVKGPKDTDVQIKVAGHTLYISRYVARYISRVTMDMVYDDEEIDSCPAFPSRFKGYQRWRTAPSAQFFARVSRSMHSLMPRTFSASASVVGPVGTIMHPAVCLIEMS